MAEKDRYYEPEEVEEMFEFIRSEYSINDIGFNASAIFDALMAERGPTTYGESRDFASEFAAWLGDDDALLAQVDRDTMIAFIESEFTADEIYDSETLADIVSENKDPEDVFSMELLLDWVDRSPFAINIERRVNALLALGLSEEDAKGIVEEILGE